MADAAHEQAEADDAIAHNHKGGKNSVARQSCLFGQGGPKGDMASGSSLEVNCELECLYITFQKRRGCAASRISYDGLHAISIRTAAPDCLRGFSCAPQDRK